MNKDRTPSAITQQPGRSPDPAETSGRAYAAHYESRCQHQVILYDVILTEENKGSPRS